MVMTENRPDLDQVCKSVVWEVSSRPLEQSTLGMSLVRDQREKSNMHFRFLVVVCISSEGDSSSTHVTSRYYTPPSPHEHPRQQFQGSSMNIYVGIYRRKV